MGQNEAHCLAELEGTRWSQRGERNGADHVFQNALAAGAIGANFIPTGMELAGGGKNNTKASGTAGRLSGAQ
jgi:hypothetical protein